MRTARRREGYRRPPKLQADYALQVFRAVFGYGNWKIVALAFLVLLSFSWFSDSVYELFEGGFNLYHGIGLLLFPFLIGGLWWMARDASPHARVVVDQDEKPQQCSALILFLSPPGQRDGQKLRSGFPTELEGRILEEKAREWFVESWRMPMESVAYHLGRPLRKVIVIASSDSPPKNGAPQSDGTYRYLDLFKDVLVRFMGDQGRWCELIGLAEIKGACKGGIDFEKAEPLVEALEEVFDWLREKRIKEYEIMVDVTGGQKIPTVAGAAVALAEGRRFQYVSTRDYKVRSYDITYRMV